MLRRLLLWSLTAVLLAGGLVGFVVYREITTNLPPVDQLLRYQPPVSTRIFADDGTLIGELYVERRYLVPLERVPPQVRLAFLAAEDANFYRHHGVSWLGILRAALANLAHHQVVQGGSTITQQVVKNLLLSTERSYERKLKELVLAVRLETKLSKDDILYLYLNQIYFGAGAYGIAAAARAFFDQDVSQLTIAQAALLAGLPQAPSRYDPQRHPRQAIARQRYVLDRMREVGFITREQYDAAVAEPLVFAPRRPATYMAAPWYVEYVRRLLEERYGGAAAQLGLRVYTAVDLQLQRAAEEALRSGLRELDQRQGFRGPIRHVDAKKAQAFLAREAEGRSPADPVRRGVVTEVRPGGLSVLTPWERGVLPADGLVWGKTRLQPQAFHPGDVIAVTVVARAPDGSARLALDQEPQVQGALVCFDPYTGEVKAMVGGYDFGRSQFNRAVQARRQPGSAFKPLIYSAAIDHGFTPASIMLDAPITVPNGSQPPWSPRNFKNEYFGPVPLREALARSLNTVTVRLVMSMGIDYVRNYLERFGLEGPLPRNLSLALGSAEVTPLELVRAYGVLATLGKRFDPIFVTAVTDDAGQPLPFAHTRPSFERVMSPATAYVITSMMETVVQKGTGHKAAELGRPVAGKTGTTNDTHDAWFIGFTPDLLAGVWVGFDSERSLGPMETGGHAAAPIWTAFMKQALDNRPIIDFPVPDGVTFAQVDPATGLRAAPGGPSKLEVFVEGHEPTQVARAADEDQDHLEPAAGGDQGGPLPPAQEHDEPADTD
ncbi:MAG TPA: PBP1A family penicillin-binding protein [Candidatus Binatia bacterium]|nr:PBP1A family penicillin-binding protein [Candidatus Binatia bacterium]